MKGVKDSSYGVLIKPDLLRQAVVPTFILANLALTSRARTFSSTSLPRARVSLTSPSSQVLSFGAFGSLRSTYMCMCVCLLGIKTLSSFLGGREERVILIPFVSLRSCVIGKARGITYKRNYVLSFEKLC